MSRLIPIAIVAAAVLACAVSSLAAPVSPPRASLRAFVCQRALDPPSRGISVQSVMRPIPGTERLAVRFQLLRRQGGAAALVRAGDLGTWISPADATLGRRAGDVWQLTKSVADLAAPADYRFRVSFRWLGRHGRILGRAVRLTADCHQPELRPDLLVKSIAVTPDPASSTVDDYTATIENDGASPTGPFQLEFTPGDGSAPKLRSLKSLGPHASIRARFRGPVCNSANPATVTADPAGEVDDRDRSNNSLTATCTAY
jgi:CARDB